MSNYTTGIDVSFWQDNNSTAQMVDWNKAYNAGARFCFIKASQSKYADEDIFYNWKSSKIAGLLRGAYHFLTWSDPKGQADFFSGLIKNDPGELPPVCDFEWWGTIPSNALDILWQFMAEVKVQLGKYPIIYSSAGFWKPYGTTNASWAQFPLWVANYEVTVPNVPLPWKNWTFWQYSSKGDGYKFGCESKNVDMDYFNGSYEDLLKFCGINSTPAPTPPPAPVPTFKSYQAKVLGSLYVRAEPRLGSAVTGGLVKGQTVTIIDEQKETVTGITWGKMADKRWCSTGYLQKLNSFQTYFPGIFK